MPKQRIIISAATLLAVAALALYFRRHPTRLADDSKAGSRLTQLQELVEQQGREWTSCQALLNR